MVIRVLSHNNIAHNANKYYIAISYKLIIFLYTFRNDILALTKTTFDGRYFYIASTNIEKNRIINANGDIDEELVLFFITSTSQRDKGFRMKWKVQTETTINPKNPPLPELHDLESRHP